MVSNSYPKKWVMILNEECVITIVRILIRTYTCFLVVKKFRNYSYGLGIVVMMDNPDFLVNLSLGSKRPLGWRHVWFGSAAAFDTLTTPGLF